MFSLDFPNIKNHTTIFNNELNLSDIDLVIQAIWPAITANTWIFLEGDLGTGKTTLMQNLIKCTGYTGTITSPTFTIINNISIQPYTINSCMFNNIIHADLYRLKNENELIYLGIERELNDYSVFAAEWPSTITKTGWELFFNTTLCSMPGKIILVNISHTDEPLKRHYCIYLVELFYKP